MNDTQLILTALSQVPDLVEAARTYVVVWCRIRMNYNSDIPIATDGNQLQRRLLSIKMAFFMDGVCKNQLLSTKRAVFMDKMWKCRNFGPNDSITWCKCGARKKKNPLRIASKRVSSTQSRGRTGTGRPTGVWDQRVYRFRHLGLKVCALTSGLTIVKNFWERKDSYFLLMWKYFYNYFTH